MGPSDTKMSRSAYGVRPVLLQELPSRDRAGWHKGSRGEPMSARDEEAATAVFDEPERLTETDEEPDAEAIAVDDDSAEPEGAPAIESEMSTDSLQLFLKDVGKVPLLTAAQEVELAKRSEE